MQFSPLEVNEAKLLSVLLIIRSILAQLLTPITSLESKVELFYPNILKYATGKQIKVEPFQETRTKVIFRRHLGALFSETCPGKQKSLSRPRQYYYHANTAACDAKIPRVQQQFQRDYH